MGIFTNIKQRPDDQKKIFSLIMAVILTFIIVTVWYSLTKEKIDSEIANKPNTLSSLSPLQVIKDEFSKVFSDIKEVVGTSTPLYSEATGGQAEEIMSTSSVSVEIINEEAISTASSTEESI